MSPLFYKRGHEHHGSVNQLLWYRMNEQQGQNWTPGRPRTPPALEGQYTDPEYLTSGLSAFSLCCLYPQSTDRVLFHHASPSGSELQVPPSLPGAFTFKTCCVSLLWRYFSRRFQNLYYGYSKALPNPSPTCLSNNGINMLKRNPVFHFKSSSNATTVTNQILVLVHSLPLTWTLAYVFPFFNDPE